MTHDVVLESRNLTKRYGATLALDGVSFRVRRGAVNVLIGENGAGKSTLMRIIAGAEMPSAGEVWKDGHRLHLRSPRDAAAEGIAIVHQELAILENLDLAENIFAGREPVRMSGFVNRSKEKTRSTETLHWLGAPLDIQAKAGDLSLGNRQVLELARSLASGASVLILDEPTSALSGKEASNLFRVIEELKARGVAIIYISHRLHELLHLGDFFTVMRDGRVVGEGERGLVDHRWIVERMSGHALNEVEVISSAACGNAGVPPTLDVRGVSPAVAGQPLPPAVNLQVRHGEIVGIYGLLGAGRTEFLETLAGLRRVRSGAIYLDGQQIVLRSVSDALQAGIALVPEDRQRDGLVPELSIRENISLSCLAAFAKGGWIQERAEEARVQQLVAELGIHARDLDLPVTSLSGGNQQRVVMARCLMRQPKLLLMDEPTRGVDVSAKAEIYRVLRALAARGLSVLFATSEIEEARQLADRILVMRQGEIVAEFAGSEVADDALFAAACPAVESAA